MLAPRTELLMHEKTFCWFWLWNPPGPGRFLEVAKQWLLNKALWIDDSMGLSESIQCIPLYIILLSITWLSLSMKWERRCSDFMEWHGMGFKHCSSGFVGPPSGTQSWQWEYIHTCVYMYIYPYTHIYIYIHFSMSMVNWLNKMVDFPARNNIWLPEGISNPIEIPLKSALSYSFLLSNLGLRSFPRCHVLTANPTGCQPLKRCRCSFLQDSDPDHESDIIT